MEIQYLADGMVRLPFEVTDGNYTLNDAIVIPQSEFEALSEADIEAIKQNRFNNWVSFIITASEEPPPEA